MARGPDRGVHVPEGLGLPVCGQAPVAKRAGRTQPPPSRTWWREDRRGRTRPGTRRPTSASRLEPTLFVLDEDPDNGGDVTLQQILDRLGEDEGIPPTLIVETGSGGRHFYFQQPAGNPVGSPKFRKGLDIKGVGG